MTPILPGRYLVIVELAKVRRARSGHAYASFGLRVVRDLRRTRQHVWVGLAHARVCDHCGLFETESARPCLQAGTDYGDRNDPGELVECICSSRSRSYETDLHDYARAAGVHRIAVPSLVEDRAENHASREAMKAAHHVHDELLRIELEKLVGHAVVVDARRTTSRGRWQAEAFVACSWSAPTPADLCSSLTLPEAVSLLGKVWRMLKDGSDKSPGRRVDEVLALLEILEVPR